MIEPLTVGYLVAHAIDRGERCPDDTAAAIRLALAAGYPAGCSCESRVQMDRRWRSVGPPPGAIERRGRARV